MMKKQILMQGQPLKMALLFVVTAAVCCGMSTTFARFATGATGSDQVRIAGFRVYVGDPERVSAENELDCAVPGDQLIYRVPVVNQSEVSVNYQVKVLGANGLDCAMTNGSGLLAPGGSQEAMLVFTVADEDDYLQSTVIMGIRVIVTAEQANGGG